MNAIAGFKNLKADLGSQTATFDVSNDFDFGFELDQIAKNSSHVAGWKLK